jgi:uncharacterized protein (DUF2249 family)
LTCIKATGPQARYGWSVTNAKVITLDVRDDIQAGREPFSRIMETVASLEPRDALRLLAPFEPVPLFGVLARQGFSHASKPLADGNWEVLFQRGAVAAEPAPGGPSATLDGGPAPCPPSADPPALDVDARGLEPPQPLVAILEALGRLPQGGVLQARTDRRPMHLYPQLEARGFTGTSQEQDDGSFITHIRHA